MCVSTEQCRAVKRHQKKKERKKKKKKKTPSKHQGTKVYIVVDQRTPYPPANQPICQTAANTASLPRRRVTRRTCRTREKCNFESWGRWYYDYRMTMVAWTQSTDCSKRTAWPQFTARTCLVGPLFAVHVLRPLCFDHGDIYVKYAARTPQLSLLVGDTNKFSPSFLHSLEIHLVHVLQLQIKASVTVRSDEHIV